jgi:hypothetical protein
MDDAPDSRLNTLTFVNVDDNERECQSQLVSAAANPKQKIDATHAMHPNTTSFGRHRQWGKDGKREI